jgi:O-antigen ligase
VALDEKVRCIEEKSCVRASESSGFQEHEERSDKKSWVGIVLGIWLCSVFAASLFGRLDAATHRSYGMLLLGTAIVWPLVYFMASRGSFFPRPLKPGMLLAITVFFLFCALSSLSSPVALESIGYTVLTLVSCWIALQFNTNLDEHHFLKGLRVYTIVMVAMLAWFALYDYVPGERLGNGKNILNPNTVGLVAMSALLSAFSIRSHLVRSVALAVIGIVIVLTGSRTALIGSLLGSLLVFWVRGRTARLKTILVVLGMSAAVLLAAYLYTELFLKGAEQLLSLHDRDRGLASGATGRFEAWEATWKLFLTDPILGVGFRAHDHYKEVGATSHNGYLALLAEIGIIGFLAALYLEAAGLLRIWKGIKDPAHLSGESICFGFGCAYLFLAVFERYFINVGNPTSLLFLLCIIRPQALGAGQLPEAPVSLASVELRSSPRVVSSGGRHQGGSSPSTSVPRGAYELLSFGGRLTRP